MVIRAIDGVATRLPHQLLLRCHGYPYNQLTSAAGGGFTAIKGFPFAREDHFLCRTDRGLAVRSGRRATRRSEQAGPRQARLIRQAPAHSAGHGHARGGSHARGSGHGDQHRGVAGGRPAITPDTVLGRRRHLPGLLDAGVPDSEVARVERMVTRSCPATRSPRAVAGSPGTTGGSGEHGSREPSWSRTWRASRNAPALCPGLGDQASGRTSPLRIS
jgi:hypothetical protein